MGGRRKGRGEEREGREKGREGKEGGTCSKVSGGIDAPGLDYIKMNSCANF